MRGRGREARLHEAIALRVRQRHAGSEARQSMMSPWGTERGLA